MAGVEDCVEPVLACQNRAHRRVGQLVQHLANSSTADPRAAADLYLSAFSDSHNSRPTLTAQQLPAVSDLKQALSIGRTMAQAQSTVRLGGLAGYKLGWKNKYTEQPALYGPLFRSGIVPQGSRISLSKHKIWCAEAEFGFTLKRELPACSARSPGYSLTEVWAAVEKINICIELCGSRHLESTDPLQYIADALSGACVVVGPEIDLPDDPFGLPKKTVEISIDGAFVSKGNATENPLDSPLASLHFLVNELCHLHQTPIPAGAFIITGHCTQAGFQRVPAPPHIAADVLSGKLPSGKVEVGGTEIRADFESYGSVSAVLIP